MKTLTGRVFVLGPFPVKKAVSKKYLKGFDENKKPIIAEVVEFIPVGRSEARIFLEQAYNQPVIRTHFPKE